MGIAASILVVWSIFLGIGAYYKGRDSRADEVAQYQAAIDRANSEAREAELRASKASAKVVTEYRDRVRTITEQRPAEIQLVEVIRAEANPPLSPSFRLLHDSAATGSQAAESAGGVDAAPVPVADAAETIRQNYATCRTDQARLTALQEIIRSQ